MTNEHIEVIKQIVKHGGGMWVGVQEAFPDETVSAYILFEAPLSGHLLMLPENEFFTVQAVEERVYNADKRFRVAAQEENS